MLNGFFRGRKGFVGPIGDDLPSLIPLLLGLVIFFSTFTIAFSAFDSRSADFKDDVGVMRISRTLQSNSYIYSYANFRELCRQIDVVNIKYAAGITADIAELDPAATPLKDIYSLSFFRSGSDEFYCSNREKSPVRAAEGKFEDFINQEEASGTKVVTRIFPIVVEVDKIVRPMHLVVIAWK